jgi:hypothetical protein
MIFVIPGNFEPTRGFFVWFRCLRAQKGISNEWNVESLEIVPIWFLARRSRVRVKSRGVVPALE